MQTNKEFGINPIEQKLIALLFVTSIFVFVNIGVFSVSFPIGLLLIASAILIDYRRLAIRKDGIALLFFIVAGIFSYLKYDFSVSFESIYFWIQLFYWLILAMYLANVYTYIDWRKISVIISIAILILGVLYVTRVFEMSQNAVAFTLVFAGPLGYYGLKKGWLKLTYATLLTVLIILNESRSGAIIVIAQFLILAIANSKVLNKNIVLIFMFMSLIAYVVITPAVRAYIGVYVETVNPDLAELLINPEKVNSEDKSWIQRRFQIQKGLQIFNENPFMGIGFNNFMKQDVEIDLNVFEDVDDRTLNMLKYTSYQRSTHNTYITILSENGIIGIFFLVLFFIPLFLIFVLNYKKLSYSFELTVFVSLFGILIYFYSISALYGTSVWLLFGLSMGAASKLKITK